LRTFSLTFSCKEQHGNDSHGEEQPTPAYQTVRVEQVTAAMQKLYPPCNFFRDNGFFQKSAGNLLHWACNNQPPVELIHFLVQHNPPWTSEKDHKGFLPLHWACGNQASVSVVRILVEQAPTTVQIRAGPNDDENENGLLPLHEAVYNNAPFEVIEYLLEKYPAATQTKASGGRLPLHLIIISEKKYRSMS
jgi:ankyrin repeat protein